MDVLADALRVCPTEMILISIAHHINRQIHLEKDSSVDLMYHELSDLRSLLLIQIIPKEHTLSSTRLLYTTLPALTFSPHTYVAFVLNVKFCGLLPKCVTDLT